MIDFTTVQLFDALPDLKALNNTNISLGKENKLLRNVLICIVVSGVVYVGYKIYKKHEEDERKLQKQLSGNKEYNKL